MVNTVHGQFEPKGVAEMTWSDWKPHLLGLKAHFLLCKAVLPSMHSHHYGRIVYVSAGLSRRLFAGCSGYSTVKAGLNVFCKTLAIEEGKHGITVNIVAPGKVVPLDGREATDNPDDWEEMNRQCLDSSPLGCPATSADVAQAVLFFASPQASGITGQTLFVAGGEIMP
jgi:3-oxoacyl-[acyl-carrier protein] reductase